MCKRRKSIIEDPEVVKLQVILCGLGLQLFFTLSLQVSVTWAWFSQNIRTCLEIKNDRGINH